MKNGEGYIYGEGYKTVDISSRFLETIRNRKLVVLAGAGVSSASPTNLPGWIKINQMIVEALCMRIESYLDRKGYLDQIKESIDQRRANYLFPPDYQAQLLEEFAGPDYFRALQSLDVNVRNAGHDSLAYLARQGVLAAIVTTNFDRLIEQALDAVSVEYEVGFDAESYERCYKAIETGSNSKLQILKVHGCVSNANSLIDTLKQRLLGRNENLNRILDFLIERHPWLYAGFSAADLETDDDYLRIIPSADKSPGILYVQWPGSKKMSVGATKLLEKYSEKAEKIVAELPDVLTTIVRVNDTSAQLPFEMTSTVDTNAVVRNTLAQWASKIHPASAVNCLAILCESNGMSNSAFELLHRFWKDVLSADREGEHFERYRQLHGRLGMGNGQLSILEDLNTTKGEESLQNLLRRDHGGDPLAATWAGVAFMWAGNRKWSENLIFKHNDKFTADLFSKEVSIDCWNAQAEVFYFFFEPERILQSWTECWKYAELAGDLPRQAKCGALTALHYAAFAPEHYEEFMNLAKHVLDRAARLNDPGIEGFLHLAAGRYLTRTNQKPTLAAEQLIAANHAMMAAGRHPWALFAQIEYAKALADNHEMEKAATIINDANKKVDRWQILSIPHAEAVGQINMMLGMKTEARKAFENAIEFAILAEIPRMVEKLQKYLVYC